MGVLICLCRVPTCTGSSAAQFPPAALRAPRPSRDLRGGRSRSRTVCVKIESEQLGLRHYDLIRNEDLDQRRGGKTAPAGVAVSRMEAIKGFEFDTVIACHLSNGVTPRPGTPEDVWREAAIVYSALTRARDELIITYEGEPSTFLKLMGPEVDFIDAEVGPISSVLNTT